jgi:nucleoside 2-deoxyribosyltransferase
MNPPESIEPPLPRVYLAGPEVFLPNPVEMGEARKKICRNHGLEGLFPLDNVLDLQGCSRPEMGYRISAANENLIRSSDAVIANLTPFRGVSADVGTVYELGLAAGLGKRIFAYTNVASELASRTCAHFQIASVEGHRLADSDDMEIENFQLHDNLMLEGGLIARQGFLIVHDAPHTERFRSLAAFETCVRQVASVLRRPQ